AGDRKMTHTEYQELRRKAEEEYRKNLEAIERVYSMGREASPNGAATATPPTEQHASRMPSNTIGGIFQAALGARGHIRPEFTRLAIAAFLESNKDKFSKKTLKSIMKKFIDQGHTDVVQKSTGRAP